MSEVPPRRSKRKSNDMDTAAKVIEFYVELLDDDQRTVEQSKEKPTNLTEALARIAVLRARFDGEDTPENKSSPCVLPQKRLAAVVSERDKKDRQPSLEAARKLDARITHALGDSRVSETRSYDIHRNSKNGGKGQGKKMTDEQRINEMNQRDNSD